MLNGLAAHNQPHDALMLQAYSKAADVFSFGVVLWELITWQMPWEELGVFQVGMLTYHPQRPHAPLRRGSSRVASWLRL